MEIDIAKIRLRKMRLLAEEVGGRPALAKKMGIAYAQLSNCIGKKPIRNIGAKMARLAEEVGGKNYGWMDVLDTAESAASGNAEHPVSLETLAAYKVDTVNTASDEISIPIFTVIESMGGAALRPDSKHLISQLTTSASWIRSLLPRITNPQNLSFIQGHGDLMEGTFSDGDMLLVDNGIRELEIDAIYIFSLNHKFYIQRLQRRHDGSILLIADNKKYEPYIAKQSDLTILGRVVLAWKKL